MQYLLSIKENLSSKPYMQRVCTENETMHYVRRFILQNGGLSDTSADLKALNILNSVRIGKAQAIENPRNGKCLVIQFDK